MMTETEFAHIVHETKGVVLSSIEKHLAARHFHAIDDVVQETYLRAYNSLTRNKFRGDSTITSWLYTIARNESFRMNDKLAREEEKFQKAMNEMIEKNRTNDQDNNDMEIEELIESITRLPEKYRSVLKLISQGYSEKEIARHLSIKKGTVKSRASRGRDLLKKLYIGEEI